MPFVLDQPVVPFWRKTGTTSGTAVAIALPPSANVIKVWVDVASLIALNASGTAPSTSATNAVQTITTTGSPASGTFKLAFLGQTTGTIAFNAAAATIDTALEALSTIGTSGVTSAGGALPTAVTVTFDGTRFTGTPVTLIQLANNSMDTGGVLIRTTTAGANPWAYQEASTQEQYTVANENSAFLYVATVSGSGNYRVSAYA